MNIIKIEKTNKKLLSIEKGFIDGKFTNKVGNHYYIYFICEKCGTEDKKQRRRFSEAIEFLCRKCLKNKTNLNKYGNIFPSKNKEVKEKIRKSTISNDNIGKMKQKIKEKYGVDNIAKVKEIREKQKVTCQERYGGNSPACSIKIKHKMKQTTLNKYGVEYTGQIEKTKLIKKQKIYKDFFIKTINNFNSIPLFDITKYNGSKENKYKWKCKNCNNKFEDYIYNGHAPRCKKCYPNITGTSRYEKEIQFFLDEIKINYEPNKRFFKNGKYKYEIDIYIPNFNIGIEFNGLYWHSEENGKDKNYHYDKYLFFKEKGINLINIFEDEWIFKKDIVKSIIKTKFNKFDKIIYGRKTIIKKVSNTDKTLFLKENHIQGDCASSINIGLYYGLELVSLMTFSKARFGKSDYELVRFCNKLNTKVIGGASKLFSSFIKKNIGSIVSYCDLRYFNGNMYSNLKFKLSHISPPNYFYVKGNNRFNRMKFQKHKLKNLLENFNPGLSEYENMVLNRYGRIFDCGNKVFILE